MRFSYCPVCGEKLGLRVCGDEGEVPFCTRCDHPWFDMFASAAIVLVVNPEGKVALLDQSYISTQYKNLVSGYIKPGESAEECAMREVKEETGLTMLNPRFRGLVTFVSDEWGVVYMHLFTCTKFSGTLTDCDEGELVWLPKGELLTKKLWEGDKLFLRALDERSDFFTLKLRYEGETLVESKFEPTF